jgi:hypothetical protein
MREMVMKNRRAAYTLEARRTRIGVAERIVGTFRSTTAKSCERLACDRRFSGVYRSFHRQRHADGV